MKKKDAIALIAAFLVLIIILILPNPDSLPLVGQRALAVLAFAVVLWVTEAVSYPVSAVMIVSLLAVLIGISPTVEDPGTIYGTSRG